MPRPAQSSAQETRPANPSQDQMPNIQEESEGSQWEDDHESDPEVSFHPCHHPQPSTSQVGHPQPTAGMYMLYIEGPCMDWMVNDGLYHRILK